MAPELETSRLDGNRHSLYALLESGKLFQKDSKGNTLVSNLEAFQGQKFGPGIDGSEAFNQTLVRVAHPEFARGNSAAALVERSRARNDPSEYVRQMAGLTRPEGVVTQAGGSTLRRDEASLRSGDPFDPLPSRMMRASLKDTAPAQLFEEQLQAPGARQAFARLSPGQRTGLQQYYGTLVPVGDEALDSKTSVARQQLMGLLRDGKLAGVGNFAERDRLHRGMMEESLAGADRTIVSTAMLGFNDQEVQLLQRDGVRLEVRSKEHFQRHDRWFSFNPAAVMGGYVKKLGDEFQSGGYYSSGSKRVVLREGNVTPGTVHHELGHALDDAQAGDPNWLVGRYNYLWGGKRNPYGSDSDEKLRKLHADYVARTGSKDDPGIWSSYARTNVTEYYAEAREAWLNPDSRAQLKQKDPELYRYLESR
ncbi:MAG: hypothetical protein HY319_01535 [Armatimonadetes bacterium]|nr:hypothetical protein [Armatimonadota bacterium]